MYVTSASNFPLSEALTLDGLLASQFTNNERLIKAGKPLFHEGDTAEYIYQIVEGVVRSSKLLANGRRQILSFGLIWSKCFTNLFDDLIINLVSIQTVDWLEIDPREIALRLRKSLWIDKNKLPIHAIPSF